METNLHLVVRKLNNNLDTLDPFLHVQFEVYEFFATVITRATEKLMEMIVFI